MPEKTSQTVWAAKWEHKHGEDISLHTTEEGARKQLVAWARGNLEVWDPYVDNLETYASKSDEDLIDDWGDITGYTESLYVEDHLLYSADAWGQ